MDFTVLTEQNFTMYAVKHYDNPHCEGEDEFNQDMCRFVSLKRLLLKYVRNGDLKERLIINHLIVLYNLFGQEAATRMLFYKLPNDTYPALKTFLVFLKRLPEDHRLQGVPEHRDIPIDINVTRLLREV